MHQGVQHVDSKMSGGHKVIVGYRNSRKSIHGRNILFVSTYLISYTLALKFPSPLLILLATNLYSIVAFCSSTLDVVCVAVPMPLPKAYASISV